MREIICEREGCVLVPKMVKARQVGGGGVILDNESYLVPIKSLKKSGVGGVKSSKASQVGKGRRITRSMSSVEPVPKKKGRRRKCVKNTKSVCKKSKKPVKSKATSRKGKRLNKKSRK